MTEALELALEWRRDEGEEELPGPAQVTVAPLRADGGVVRAIP